MAQTAAQRAAKDKAAQEQAAADAAAPAQEEVDEFAPEGAVNSDQPGDSAQAKTDDAAEKLAAAEAERDAAQATNRRLIDRLAEVYEIPEEGEGVTRYDIADEILERAVADIEAVKNAPTAEATPEPAPQPAAASAIRVTVAEVDATGQALRKYGASIPLVSANPESVGATVKRTVQQILAISFDPAPALEQEPVEG